MSRTTGDLLADAAVGRPGPGSVARVSPVTLHHQPKADRMGADVSRETTSRAAGCLESRRCRSHLHRRRRFPRGRRRAARVPLRRSGRPDDLKLVVAHPTASATRRAILTLAVCAAESASRAFRSPMGSTGEIRTQTYCTGLAGRPATRTHPDADRSGAGHLRFLDHPATGRPRRGRAGDLDSRQRRAAMNPPPRGMGRGIHTASPPPISGIEASSASEMGGDGGDREGPGGGRD